MKSIYVVRDYPGGPQVIFSTRQKALAFCRRLRREFPREDWTLSIRKVRLDTGRWLGR